LTFFGTVLSASEHKLVAAGLASNRNDLFGNEVAVGIEGIWIAFLLSVGLSQHFHWIRTAWNILFLSILVAPSAYFVLETIRHPKGTASGYPRWFLRFALDEKGRKQKQQKPVTIRNTTDC
jgi:hypothetical protein